MTPASHDSLTAAVPAPAGHPTGHPRAAAFGRTAIIALMALLTTVDLFAIQALLPSLAQAYGVSPAAMGTAVNASTFGMAAGGLGIALFGRRISRRWGVVVSLAVLAIPTALLSVAPDLTTFTLLRVVQGVFMAAAFTLTLAYLGENCSAADTAGAFAAYITGNVASNLVGRLVAAAVADHFGLAWSFWLFAALNLAGAALVYVTLNSSMRMTTEAPTPGRSPFAVWKTHLRNRALASSFAIGFCILFAFIGTFTYVNFELVKAPIALDMMALGFVYFVFLPSIVTTPLAGRLAARLGVRKVFWAATAVALAGLPLLLAPHLAGVSAGMVLVAVGTFFAQAVATAFVGKAATSERGAASGLYLGSYFLGGIVGAALVGAIYDALGWSASVAAIGIALVVSLVLSLNLKLDRARPA